MYFNFCTLIDSKMRVDIYLSALFNDFSRRYIQKMVDRWYVEVNGIVINKNIKSIFGTRCGRLNSFGTTISI